MWLFSQLRMFRVTIEPSFACLCFDFLRSVDIDRSNEHEEAHILPRMPESMAGLFLVVRMCALVTGDELSKHAAPAPPALAMSRAARAVRLFGDCASLDELSAMPWSSVARIVRGHTLFNIYNALHAFTMEALKAFMELLCSIESDEVFAPDAWSVRAEALMKGLLFTTPGPAGE